MLSLIFLLAVSCCGVLVVLQCLDTFGFQTLKVTGNRYGLRYFRRWPRAYFSRNPVLLGATEVGDGTCCTELPLYTARSCTIHRCLDHALYYMVCLHCNAVAHRSPYEEVTVGKNALLIFLVFNKNVSNTSAALFFTSCRIDCSCTWVPSGLRLLR